MRIFNDKKKKKNYRIIHQKLTDNQTRIFTPQFNFVVQFNLFGSVWIRLRKQDFKKSIFTIQNRFIFYSLLLIISIILPFFMNPLFTSFYLMYVLFIPAESFDNPVEKFDKPIESVSREIDELLMNNKEKDRNDTRMMFNEKGESITGKQLDRLKKFKNVL